MLGSVAAHGELPVKSSTPEALWSARSVRVLRPAAVNCQGLHRRPLLDGFSLRVPVGSRLLLVAEPDASASLLVRALAGLARVHGRIEMAGMSDPSREGWARRVAYLGPDPGLYAWMSPREALQLAARLAELPHDEAARRTEAAVEHYGLAGSFERPMIRGGPGLMQRVGLATALLGDPEVLLLDEPLRALDPDERARLLKIPGSRRTVIMASRYPASEGGICTGVALIRAGRLAFAGPISGLDARGLPLSMRGIEMLAAATPGSAG
jgi:ABC-2 type transport system ATP-binding protein